MQSLVNPAAGYFRSILQRIYRCLFLIALAAFARCGNEPGVRYMLGHNVVQFPDENSTPPCASKALMGSKHVFSGYESNTTYSFNLENQYDVNAICSHTRDFEICIKTSSKESVIEVSVSRCPVLLYFITNNPRQQCRAHSALGFHKSEPKCNVFNSKLVACQFKGTTGYMHRDDSAFSAMRDSATASVNTESGSLHLAATKTSFLVSSALLYPSVKQQCQHLEVTMTKFGFNPAIRREEGEYCLVSGEISKGRYLHIDLVRNLVLLILDMNYTTIFIAFSREGAQISCNMGIDYEDIAKSSCATAFNVYKKIPNDAWEFDKFATLSLLRQIVLRAGNEVAYDFVSSVLKVDWLKMSFNKTVISLSNQNNSMNVFLSSDWPIVAQYNLAFC